MIIKRKFSIKGKLINSIRIIPNPRCFFNSFDLNLLNFENYLSDLFLPDIS